ncbi:ABC transporter permease [Candidatus Bathyarchaeota archaeon]|nr:ABC transporter permease [Candidatus Bathyarchaeota archaeon]
MKFGKIVKDVLVITALKAIPELKRQPLVLMIMGLISALPIFFILVFGGEISHGLVGAMISTVGFLGVASAIQDIASDRYVKIREIIVAMPVHPVSYMIGTALAPLIFSLPGFTFFLAVALWFNFIPLQALGWVIVSLLLCWAVLSGIGFVVSTYLRKASIYTLNNLSNILGLGLVFLPPVYYPEELLGGLSWIGILFPTSNAAGLIRAYSGLADFSQNMVLIRWIALLAMMVISALLVAFKARWREV